MTRKITEDRRQVLGTFKPKYLRFNNNKSFLLRTAKLKDAKELLGFMRKINSERIYCMEEPEEYRENISSYRKRIKKFKESPGKIYLVAEHNKKIIGLISFDNFNFIKSRHAGYFTIFISKPWREKGLGRQLINELLIWAKQNELIEKVSLCVFSTNKRAVNLYRNMGFKQEGRCIKDLKIKGKYADNILMYKFV